MILTYDVYKKHVQDSDMDEATFVSLVHSGVLLPALKFDALGSKVSNASVFVNPRRS